MALSMLVLYGPTAGWSRLVAGRGERATATSNADASAPSERKPDFDVARVTDPLRHEVKPVSDHPSELGVSDPRYQVRFGSEGIALHLPRTGSPATSYETTPAFSLALASVTRGTQSTALDPKPWSARQNVTERRVAPSISERVTSRDGEIEWDVVLGAPPVGVGDLRVSARVDGITRTEHRGDGLRLVLDDGKAVTMGSLVVKDVTGAEVYRAVPRVEGGRVHLHVPHKILAGARYPLILDPTVSPERTVSAATSSQKTPDIAFDGTNYLVVWTDNRNGTTSDIYGTRVSADGVVLDSAGTPISTAANDQQNPQVSYYGPHYLVVWEDLRNGNLDIYGARVRTNGTVVDATGTGFSTAAGHQFAPDLAFDGTNYLVVWADRRNPTYDIYGTRWSPTSGVLEPGGIPISTAANTQSLPALVHYGTDYLVVWTDYRNGTTSDIYGAVVFTSGVVRDTGGAALITQPNDQASPALAYDGNVVLIVWHDFRSSTSYDIYGARWSPTSGLLDGGGLAISAQNGNQERPDVAANGSFLVVWSDRRDDVYGARVASNGSVTDPNGFAITTGPGADQYPAVIKGNGDDWGTTYDRDTDSVFFRSVSAK